MFNKNQELEIFEVPNQKQCKCTAGVIIPVICYLLVFAGYVVFLCLPLTTSTYARCLLNRDTSMSAWFEEKINVDGFSRVCYLVQQ